MRTVLVVLAVLSTVLAKEASAQCPTSCATVTPAQPVVLVHGRNDSKARWDTLVSAFSGRGYTEGVNLFRLDMLTDCGDRDFCEELPAHPTDAGFVNESYALCLKSFIDEKVPCNAEGCPAVDIITHSQGGVVARWYAQNLAAPREVNDLVIMAGTHNGITNCGFAAGCGGVNPEVCPDSVFLRTLNGVAPQGNGLNDMTPSGSTLGPIHYGAVASTGDKTVPPWCGGFFILDPHLKQGDDLNCTSPNYTLDPDAASCKLSSVQHLAVPTNSSAINFAYCEVNKD